MDESLRALERAVEADPDDAATTRRYEQALRRSGEEERLRARYRLKFLCPLRFSDLSPTPHGHVRDCARCERPVRLTPDLEALAEAVAQGECVAFPREWAEQAIVRLSEEPELDSAREARAPCVVPSEVAWLDLGEGSPARAALEPGLAGLFWSEDLYAWPAFPLRVAEGGVLELAVGSLEPPPGVLERIQLASGTRRERLALADPAQLYELLDRHAPAPPLLLGVVLPEPPGPGLDSGPRLA